MLIRTIHLLRKKTAEEYASSTPPRYSGEDNFMKGGNVQNYVKMLFYRHFKRVVTISFIIFVVMFSYQGSTNIIAMFYLMFVLFFSRSTKSLKYV